MKNKILPSHTADNASQWRGYTLDQLQYERFVTLACIELEKEKMADLAMKTRDSLPFVGNSGASFLLHSLGKLDYIVFIFKLYRKLSSIFHKKKS